MKHLKFLFLLLVWMFIASCALLHHEKSSEPDQTLKLLNTSDFIEGCKEKILGNYVKAETLFLSNIKTDPSHSAAMYELAEIYSNQKQLKKALPFIEKAVKIEPDNVWYQELYAKILTSLNRIKESTSIYEKLVEKHPANIEYYYSWAMGFLLMEKYSDAILVYDKIEEKIGVTEEISTQKKKIYMVLRNDKKAIEEVQKLIKVFPNESSYYNDLAELYLMSNMNNEAFEAYQKILQINPNDAEVHLSLAEYYRTVGNKIKSFEELKLAFSNSYLDIDSKIKILLSYYTITENSVSLKEQAFTLLDILEKTHPADAKAYSMYGDFLYRDDKLTEAREKYRKVIALDSSRYAIWEQLLLIESELNDNVAFEGESKRAIDLYPEQPTLYLFNGIANFSLKKYPEAIASLNKGIKLVVYNKKLLNQFYVYLGDASYANANYKEAYTAFDNSLAIEPGNSYVLNNYSYYLSERGEELEKAEKMSKKALELSPDDKNILDTYAWILYKQAKYKDAETWINKAIEKGGSESAVIIEHSGDILFKLDQIDKALEQWKKDKEKGQGSDLLEKKIKDKKLYE